MAKRANRRLTADQHVARHVGRQRLDIDPDTGEVRGILFPAFELRPGETGLSVNHLEHFAGSAVDQLRSIKRDMSATRKVGSTSGYGVLNVGRTEAVGKRYSRSLQAFKKPEPTNLSHAEIRGLPSDNTPMELAQQLADEAFARFFKASVL